MTLLPPIFLYKILKLNSRRHIFPAKSNFFFSTGNSGTVFKATQECGCKRFFVLFFFFFSLIKYFKHTLKLQQSGRFFPNNFLKFLFLSYFHISIHEICYKEVDLQQEVADLLAKQFQAYIKKKY